MSAAAGMDDDEQRMPGPPASVIAQPSLDELRAEALEWGRKPRAFGAWYVTEHMVRAMRAYGWTIIGRTYAETRVSTKRQMAAVTSGITTSTPFSTVN